MEKDTAEMLFLKHFITVFSEKLKDVYAISKAPSDFESGKSLVYYEVADLLVECSNLFNLPLKKLGVKNFNPDDLL